MADLPSNSYNNRQKAKDDAEKSEERPEVKKVVTGKVVQRKKGIGSALRENLGGEDARSVGSYIFIDVLIPAVKSMLADAASQGVERLLFGDSRGRARVSGTSRTGTSYNRMYSSTPSGTPKRELSSRGRSSHNFDEIIVASRGEAEEILDQLGNLVDDYGFAKVSDFYALVDITGTYVDERWGWDDLRTASTSRVRAGYRMDLPTPILLDNK